MSKKVTLIGMLGEGKFATVDNSDYKDVSKYEWRRLVVHKGNMQIDLEMAKYYDPRDHRVNSLKDGEYAYRIVNEKIQLLQYYIAWKATGKSGFIEFSN